MAISQETKRVVHRQVAQLKQQWNALKATKEEYQTNILTINDQMTAVKAEYDALIKDIPEPTPAPEV